MKREGHLWEKLVSIENIKAAYDNARKGKMYRPDVIRVCKDPMPYLLSVQKMLVEGTFQSSEYRMFTIIEKGKTREVADLPFYPDRIVHWAVMLVIHDMIMKNLIPQTYAALPGRGSHLAVTTLKRYLKDEKRARFYLKIDIKKYFPSIIQDILMQKLRRKIKDEKFLDVIERIVYQYPFSGLPIGNYTSQYFANFYLSELDHFMKEKYHCQYYMRYMDDIIILGESKTWLRRALKKIEKIIEPWGLTVKSNWCIRPISEGIDFVGYVTFPRYCLLRKRTKKRMKKATLRIIESLSNGTEPDAHIEGTIASYYGCLKWCDGYNLYKCTIGLLNELIKARTWTLFKT